MWFLGLWEFQKINCPKGMLEVGLICVKHSGKREFLQLFPREMLFLEFGTMMSMHFEIFIFLEKLLSFDSCQGL
jgi:hypothetical protein